MIKIHTDMDPANRDAATQLKDSAWAVQIGRGMIDDYCDRDNFGALVAYAAVLAWRDRGPGWYLDTACEVRIDAERPPGGWARMIGVSRWTWIAWRDMAIDLDLISETQGAYASGATVPLLRPVDAVKKREHEQFARIPCAALFNPKLSRTGKRVLFGLSLYRNKAGRARVAVPTIATRAGLNERTARRGLRDLEKAGAIKTEGRPRRVRTYEIIEPKTKKSVAGTPPQCSGNAPTVVQERPHSVAGTPPQSVAGAPPYQESSRESSRKENQENLSRGARSPAKGPIPYRRDNNQPVLPLMSLVKDKKDARQGATDINAQEPEPTPEYRRERIASLGEVLSTMKINQAGYKTLKEARDNHVAALDGDTGARATA